MSDEEAKAKAAAAAGPAAAVGKTLFQKIVDREIPADIIYEDDHVVFFILNLETFRLFSCSAELTTLRLLNPHEFTAFLGLGCFPSAT